MHPDGAREIRGGVLMMIPVLPMPMMCSRPLDGEHQYTIQPTHGLIAHLLNIAASHGSQTQHQDRQVLQKIAEEALFRSIDALDSPPSTVDQVWGAFCEYKRAYIESFTGRSSADVQFLDASAVTCHTSVFDLALDHAKAHDIFFGQDDRVGEVIAHQTTLSYQDLVLRAAKRLWWTGRDVGVLPGPVSGEYSTPVTFMEMIE